MTLTLADLSLLVGIYAVIAAGLYVLLRNEFHDELQHEIGILRAEMHKEIGELRERVARIEGRLEVIIQWLERVMPK